MSKIKEAREGRDIVEIVAGLDPGDLDDLQNVPSEAMRCIKESAAEIRTDVKGALEILDSLGC